METKNQDELNQEIELKLQLLNDVEAASIYQLPYVKQGLIGAPEKTFLYSVYYDSLDHRLLKQGYSLRMRKNNGAYTLTIKKMGNVTAGLHQRAEWNYPVSTEVPSLEIIEDQELQECLNSVLEDQGLKALMVTDFKRTQSNWQDEDGNLLELAIDEGHIEIENRREIIREVELELKKGQVTALLSMGEELALWFPMIPGNDSKFYRGLQMLGLENQGVPSTEHHGSMQLSNKKENLGNDVPALLAEAFQQVLTCYQQLSQHDITDEGVHQIRVSCRHVRSLLHFFKPALVGESWQPLEKELRSLAKKFAKLREIQVMKYHYQQSPCAQTCKQLEEIIGEQYDKEWKLAEKIMKSGEITPNLLRLWRMVTAIQLKNSYKNKSTSAFTEERLSSWIQKYNKRHAELARKDMKHLHQVRIRAKRIRYAAEWLRPVLPKKLFKTIKTLKEQQELMGQLHDIHCERVKLRGWIDQKGPTTDSMYQLGFYEGWQEKQKHQLWQSLIKG